MTFFESERVKKAGCDAGWTIVESETPDAVVLGSSAHSQQVTIRCCDQEIDAEFTALVNEAELRFNGLYHVAGHVVFVEGRDYSTLRAVLQRVQQLFLSLPNSPVDIYNARWQELVKKGLDATETEEMAKRRVGQDVYREALENYWKGACAVTGCHLPEALRASHAKPWADCVTAEERLCVYNGFLLTANLDALFDKGLVTFDDEGCIVISTTLTDSDLSALGITRDMHLRWLDAHHIPFLQYHREHVWKG